MSFECECKKTLESKKSLNKHQKKCRVRVHVMEISRLKANHKAEIALLNDELASVKASLRAQHKDEIAKLESRHKDELISLLKSAPAVTPVAPAGTQAPAAPKVQKRISDADFHKLCNPVSWTTFLKSLEVTDTDIMLFYETDDSVPSYSGMLIRNLERFDHLTRPIRMIDRSRGKFEIYEETWLTCNEFLKSWWNKICQQALKRMKAMENEGNFGFSDPDHFKDPDQMVVWHRILRHLLTTPNIDKIVRVFLSNVPMMKADKDAYLESQ